MLLSGGPANLGGKDGSGEFSGLAIAAMVVSLSRPDSADFGGGTGGSGAFSGTSGASGARSSCDSNSKVGRAGKAGGAGRAFEKRDRPDFGGCRVAAPIILSFDAVPRPNQALLLRPAAIAQFGCAPGVGSDPAVVPRHASQVPHGVSHIDGGRRARYPTYTPRLL
jgi:hypothetical protein